MAKPQIWKPKFFSEFSDVILIPANRVVAKRHDVRIVIGANGEYVYGLTNAASKWRVANSITSFNADILQATPVVAGEHSSFESKISQKLCNSYSAQMQIALAVFAFEAYAGCFGSNGRDWYQHKQVVFKLNNLDLSRKLRQISEAERIRLKLEGFLAKETHKNRLNRFFSGEDEFLYDFCHFVRHAYAHGALRGYQGLIDVSSELKLFILNGIRAHLVRMTEDCKTAG
ncbi:hypothetical protein [Paragemmobacter ruber]|uniref:ApeA N-terminal domain-containing protein n=1 Tax=Paragemmobacter ruber TaxID=1985673 RepID=A0ABW9Y5Z4_9RHOB|nr:hypothetical protein [Rhodobacter ruber]NBE07978.1 hypothetical protein [Rhodobacter ruber]